MAASRMSARSPGSPAPASSNRNARWARQNRCEPTRSRAPAAAAGRHDFAPWPRHTSGKSVDYRTTVRLSSARNRTLVRLRAGRKARARPADRKGPVMSRLLHISSSPRGAASESLRIASVFIETYRDAHPEAEVGTWDLWDGRLSEFGPAA